MTLGLAVADAHAIYLAMDSEGLPAAADRSPHWLIDSKIIELQSQPEIVALVAGGLMHWSHVVQRYSNQPTVREAATSLVQLLNSCIQKGNEAFAIVCGFQSQSAICFRVNRPKESLSAVDEEASLSKLQGIGYVPHVEAATQSACAARSKGNDWLLSLVEAIQGQFPGPYIRPPVHVRVIRPEVDAAA